MKNKPIKCYDNIKEIRLYLNDQFREEDDDSKILGPKVMKIYDWSAKMCPT